ncbi:serine/threonine-protein kinase [bacterium]|nr:serine/threonine-protein kinase [bacterium]
MNESDGHNVEEDEHFDLIQRLEDLWNSEPEDEFLQAILPSQIGQYRIEEVIGTGGMGIVYRSWDETRNLFVALKLLIRSSPSQANVKRFRQEALAVARLSHPGIVRVYSFGDYEGKPWISMALIDGPTLEQKIQSNHQLEGRVAASLIADVADAMHYAHQQGVIHRDLKPSNILIDDKGKPQICDFGLAKISESNSSLTNTGEIIGSAAWMSPEQARGDTDQVTERSDVYSIGTILYQCLIGRRVFQSASHLETLRQVCDVEPVAVRQVDPSIDRDLETICARCLEKSPDQRFATADELAKELQRYLNYEPIHSRPLTRYQRAIRWCRRKPQHAIAIGLALLLTAALTLGIPWLIVEQALRREAVTEAGISRQVAEQQQKVAETEKYFSTLIKLREDPPVKVAGWKSKKLEQLQSVANLDVKGKAPVELRSILANLLSKNDLEEVAVFADGIDSRAVAFSPDGKLAALAEIRPDSINSDLRVYLYRIEPNSDGDVTVTPWISRSLYEHADVVSRTVRRFHQGGGWEGAMSLCFSSDSKRIVVATRHGRILEWSLTKPLHSWPRVIKSYGEKTLDKCMPIQFLSGDRLLAGMRGEGDMFPLIIDAQNGDPIWVSDRPAKANTVLPFGSLNGNECLLNIYHDGHETVSNFDEPKVERFAGPSFQDIDHYANKHSIVGVESSGQKRCLVYDFRDNRKTLKLRNVEDQFELVVKPKFGADSLTVLGLVFGKRDELRLRVWDGLSGAIDAELPVLQMEQPRLAISQKTGQLLVGFNDGAKLYRISGPTASSTSKTKTPFQAMAVGPRRILSFAIDETGHRIALLESESVKSEQRNVRIVDLATGVELNCWAMHGPSEQEFAKIPLEGATMCFDGPDAIILASKLPGFHCRLSDEGITPTLKQFMPFVSVDPELESPKSVAWKVTVPQEELSSPHGSWNICFSFRLSKTFFQNDMSPDTKMMKVSTEINGVVRHETALTAGELRLGKANWQLKNLPMLTRATAGDEVELKVESTLHNLLINAPSVSNAERPSNDAVGVEMGNAHLFAIRKSILGPIAKLGDGDWLTVTDDPLLNRWNDRKTDVQCWEDSINEFAHVRDFCIGNRSAIAGTRWGNVFQFSDEIFDSTEPTELTGWKSIRQIDSLERNRGGGNTLEEIVAVAMDSQDHYAVVGNRGGDLMLFDLTNADNQAVSRSKFRAHQNVIIDVAMSPDGSTVFSSAIDRKLKVWRRDGDRLSLFFEIDSLDNPVAKMEVSPDNRKLYFLCDGDRGIRIINLLDLKQKFEEMNLLK